jgi:hypothetical protein
LFDAIDSVIGGRANIKPPLLINHSTDFNSFDFDKFKQYDGSDFITTTQSQPETDHPTTPASDPSAGDTKQLGKKGRKRRQSASLKQESMVEVMQERWKKRDEQIEADHELRTKELALQREKLDLTREMHEKDLEAKRKTDLDFLAVIKGITKGFTGKRKSKDHNSTSSSSDSDD